MKKIAAERSEKDFMVQTLIHNKLFRIILELSKKNTQKEKSMCENLTEKLRLQKHYRFVCMKNEKKKKMKMPSRCGPAGWITVEAVEATGHTHVYPANGL